jgi:hypothetical protein
LYCACAVGVAAIVRLLNVNVPLLLMEEPAAVMVIVPLVGVKVPVTVKARPTDAVLPAPVIEPLTFNPPYVRLDNTCPAPL